MKQGLCSLSSSLSLKVYKRAGGDLFLKSTFDKQRDYRVLIAWKGEPIEGSQFIVDRQFWHMSNQNDGDRGYMRSLADRKLNAINDAMNRGKDENKHA